MQSERPAYFVNAPLALIIGCGDMGVGCARALGQRSPLFLVDLDRERLEACVAALRQEGFAAEGLACDITDAAQVRTLGDTLAERNGVRVLAHVAAIGASPGGWRKVMDVDLIGAHRIARMAEPHMKPGGAAILISSTGAYQCPASTELDGLLDEPLRPGFFDGVTRVLGREPETLEAYHIAKQGVNRLAARLAIEWGAREVRALSVSPGLIDSSMGRTAGALLPIYDGGSETRLGTRSEKAAKEVPLSRQGSVLEITSVVAFLASDEASFINGVDIPVDGGSTALRRARGLIAR
jgi:NAD(P)-dependent dehydrogenase (short-subunit alcohol dehydrogenase family)